MQYWEKQISSVAEMENLAALVAKYVFVGDVICLQGDLGVGKTTFSRAFIQAMAGEEIAVPSPTFTLVQTYMQTRLPVAHVDAYRLSSSDELHELDLQEFYEGGVTLVEWAEKVADALPDLTLPKGYITAGETPDKLTIQIEEGAEEEQRTVKLVAEGTWRNRFGIMSHETSRPVTEEGRREFLDNIGVVATDMPSIADQFSFRRYFRIETTEGTRVIMDAPPPMENVKPFLKQHQLFSSLGVHVPTVYAKDEEKGYLLLEDFGDFPFSKGLDGNADKMAWLERMVDLLVHIAKQPKADILQYNFQTVWGEACRYTDWTLPYMHGHATSPSDREAYRRAWMDVYDDIMAVPQGITHWDCHADNLMMVGDTLQDGFDSIGVLDFQDARMAPVSFDLACFLQDRWQTPLGDEVEQQLIRRFVDGLDGAVTMEKFMASYHLVSLHRFLMVTGLYTRAKNRDGRVNMPWKMGGLWKIIGKNAQHPACAPIARFVEQMTPREIAV